MRDRAQAKSMGVSGRELLEQQLNACVFSRLDFRDQPAELVEHLVHGPASLDSFNFKYASTSDASSRVLPFDVMSRRSASAFADSVIPRRARYSTTCWDSNGESRDWSMYDCHSRSTSAAFLPQITNLMLPVFCRRPFHVEANTSFQSHAA